MKRFVLVPATLLFVAAVAVQAQQQPSAQSRQAQMQQRPAESPLAPNQWRIDSGHSQAGFSVRHNVVSTARGVLGPISGKIEYDGKDVRSIVADVVIDVTKINTQNERRDTHLRSDEFLNTEKFPTMTFKSKRVEPGTGGKFRLIGDLTIRDKTNEVVLDVEGPSAVVKSQRGVLTGASATTKISRKAFGVLWNGMIEALPAVGDEVTVTIDLELNRPAAPGMTAAQQ